MRYFLQCLQDISKTFRISNLKLGQYSNFKWDFQCTSKVKRLNHQQGFLKTCDHVLRHLNLITKVVPYMSWACERIGQHIDTQGTLQLHYTYYNYTGVYSTLHILATLLHIYQCDSFNVPMFVHWYMCNILVFNIYYTVQYISLDFQCSNVCLHSKRYCYNLLQKLIYIVQT